jgi:hypothetical protein
MRPSSSAPAARPVRRSGSRCTIKGHRPSRRLERRASIRTLRTSGWIGKSTLVASMSRACESVLRIGLMILSPVTSSKRRLTRSTRLRAKWNASVISHRSHPPQPLRRDRIDGIELLDRHPLAALVRQGVDEQIIDRIPRIAQMRGIAQRQSSFASALPRVIRYRRSAVASQ